MISILHSDSINQAKDYFVKIQTWIENRIDKSKIDNANKANLKADLRAIISGKLPKLITLQKKYIKIFPKDKEYYKNEKGETKIRTIANKQITSVFDYSAFRSKFGFELAQDLDVSCCPYCNRNYTTSHETIAVGRKKVKTVFPEFDHFLPKSEYPLLAISYFNLIPSCTVCNTHFKQAKDPLIEKIFYPYTKLKNSGFNFKFYPEDYESLIGKKRKIKLRFSYNETPSINEQLEKSLDFFGIQDTYEKCHTDFINEIIEKRITYSKHYLDSIKSIYGLDFESAYRILFESDYKNADMGKRPFSKLKRDIYDDLEIAKYY